MVNRPALASDVESALNDATGLEFSNNFSPETGETTRDAVGLGAYFSCSSYIPDDDDTDPLIQNTGIEINLYQIGRLARYPYREDWLKEVALVCGWHISQRCPAPVVVVDDDGSVLRLYNHPMGGCGDSRTCAGSKHHSRRLGMSENCQPTA